jgi:hypothetical protein
MEWERLFPSFPLFPTPEEASNAEPVAPTVERPFWMLRGPEAD